MKIIQLVTGFTSEYLKAYDPDGGNLAVAYPIGIVISTPDPAKALRFATTEEAWACWRLQSRRTPHRPDGQPNRPLTAYTITIANAPESQQEER